MRKFMVILYCIQLYVCSLQIRHCATTKGIIEDVWIVVGHSYVLADFVIIETGGDEKAPIILGRPFLSTTKAIIYVTKICFTINGIKERFNFKKRTLNIRVHP
jgi:hypothetical protein